MTEPPAKRNNFALSAPGATANDEPSLNSDHHLSLFSAINLLHLPYTITTLFSVQHFCSHHYLHIHSSRKSLIQSASTKMRATFFSSALLFFAIGHLTSAQDNVQSGFNPTPTPQLVSAATTADSAAATTENPIVCSLPFSTLR